VAGRQRAPKVDRRQRAYITALDRRHDVLHHGLVAEAEASASLDSRWDRVKTATSRGRRRRAHALLEKDRGAEKVGTQNFPEVAGLIGSFGEINKVASSLPPSNSLPDWQCPLCLRWSVRCLVLNGMAFSRFDQDREEDVEKAEFADPVPRPQNTRTIAIERFVPAGQVDLQYFERARGRPR
jgi:hypothetical protein